MDPIPGMMMDRPLLVSALIEHAERFHGAVPVVSREHDGSLFRYTYAEASGRAIPYEIVPRRPGDVAECWADPTKAQRVLGWRAERGLHDMCASTWAFTAGQRSASAPHTLAV